MRLAAPYVPAGAVVFSEQAAYYAAKQNGAVVILPTYIAVIRNEDKARVSVAIVQNTDAARLARDFGGKWRKVAAYARRHRHAHRCPDFTNGWTASGNNLKVFVRSH